MSDPFQDAKKLFSDVNRLIKEIKDAGTEVARLKSSQSTINREEDPAVFHSRLTRARNALSELKDQLIQIVDKLSQFAPQIVDLSNRYSHDAGIYSKTAQYAGVDKARYQVEQAAYHAGEYAQKRSGQVEEIRLMIECAQRALNMDFGVKPISPSFSTSSIDGLLGEPSEGLEGFSSSPRVDVGSYGSYSPSIDSNVYNGFPGYRPGAYSLYTPGNFYAEGRKGAAGMEWI